MTDKEIQKAKEFIIKYTFIGNDYTDESCDLSITIPLIRCAKLLASYAKNKDETIAFIRKQRNDYEAEIKKNKKETK